MVEPLRHRQTKEAATDMLDLKSPRHTSTLPKIGPLAVLTQCPDYPRKRRSVEYYKSAVTVVRLSQPFREVTFCASYKSHCLGSCGSRLSWLWGEGVPSRVARGAPNSAAAARDDLAPAYPTLNM